MVQLLHAISVPGLPSRPTWRSSMRTTPGCLPICETLIALLQASPGAAAAFGRIRQLEPGGDIPIPRRERS